MDLALTGRRVLITGGSQGIGKAIARGFLAEGAKVVIVSRDQARLQAALADGTIDALVSDHTPVDEDGKHLPFGEAEPGATGLELLLPLALKWGEAHKLPLATTLARISSDPARILGVGSGRIAIGAPADLAIFDPRESVLVSAETLRSQGKNTPFLGYELAGRVRYTLVAGNVVFEA